MAKLGAAHSIGTVIGPSLALLAAISLLTPLYFAALMTFIAAMLVAFFLPNLPASGGNNQTAHKPFWQVGFDRRYMPFISVGVVMFMAYAVVQQTLGFYFADKLGLDSKEAAQVTGIALMCGAVMSLVAQGVIVQKFKWSPKKLMRRGLPLMCVGFIIFPFATETVYMFIAMGFIGLGMGLTAPGFTAAASLAVEPEEQGQVAGALGACPALGFILGPIIGTGLYQLNPVYPYYFSAMVFVPLIFFVFKVSARLDSTL